ncbi:MAG: hypothetical protein QM503_08320 [Bacteroidota bacterium]
MESTVSYILIAVIMALVITVYNFKKKQIRYYLLSLQQYPELDISVNIKKTQGKISDIIIRVTANKNITLSDVKVELISKKREFNYYSLQKFLVTNTLPLKLNKADKTEFAIPFDEFKALLMDGEFPFSTYRFMVVSDTEKTFKSHEMGFNKRWVIYRPDTGNYN